MAPKKTPDALAILHARYVRGNAEAEMELENARERLRLSNRLLELRQREGLTQKELAQRAGTTRSVIARLEQPGYEKHTVSSLHRVARALGYEVKIEFAPLPASKRKPAPARQ
ncbi:MAG: helix-turn-helix transcriptional regulator [Sumerlaeia bacterium]